MNIDEQNKVGQEILRELSKTANLLSNSSQGEKEKKIEVTFATVSNSDSVTVDMQKFMVNGKINYDEKAILQEKGRLLTRQELLRQTTSQERLALEGFASSHYAKPEVKTIFNGIVAKNSIDSVKEKWEGFKAEIESFKDSIGTQISVNQSSSYNDKIKAIIEKWTLDNANVDFGDSGIQENWKDFQEILDFVQQQFKNPTESFERLDIAKKFYEEILKRLKRLKENPSPSPEGESPEGKKPEGESPEGKKPEGESPEGESPEGESPEGESPEGKSPEGEKPEGKKPEGESPEGKSPEGESLVEDIMERMIKVPENHSVNRELCKIKLEDDSPTSAELKSEDWDSCKVKYCVWKNKVTPEAKTNHRRFLIENRKSIEAIKAAFAFKQVELTRATYGKTLGDLDVNGLHKFHMGEKVRLFEEKEIPKGKKYTIGILLDQSGSMSNNSKIEQARKVALIIVEALRQIKGIDLCVWGHTADCYKLSDRGKANEIDMIPYFQKGMDFSQTLVNAISMSNNGDGFAIRFISERMLEINPSNSNSMHHLFVISDGEPAANCYDSIDGINHTGRCVQQARNNGVEVYGIGICNAFSEKTGQLLYGKGNFVVLKDTASSLPLLCREIKKLISK